MGIVLRFLRVVRLFGGCITFIGMGMVALPAGILASAFSDQLQLRREAYSHNLHDALEDGVITDEQSSELARSQEELGLSENDARHLE